MPRTNRLTPAARRHLPRLLVAGWVLTIIPAHTAHGVDWPQSVTLERPAHSAGSGNSNFEARGRTVAQAVAVARGTSRSLAFWVPGETSGADHADQECPFVPMGRAERRRVQQQRRAWLTQRAAEEAQRRADGAPGFTRRGGWVRLPASL